MNNEKTEARNVGKIVARRFSKMTGLEKTQYVGKVIIALLSLGFIFPTILND
jgi:hypothetical protein